MKVVELKNGRFAIRKGRFYRMYYSEGCWVSSPFYGDSWSTREAAEAVLVTAKLKDKIKEGYQEK